VDLQNLVGVQRRRFCRGLSAVSLRGSYGEGFANLFWSGIGLQRKRGEEKYFLDPENNFQVQAFQTELQASSTMPGLESLFWRGIRLQRR